MLIGLNETIEMIQSGQSLHIAADEKLLAKLPLGNWIGGTTPYFMAEEGGILTEERLFVQSFDSKWSTNICVYDNDNIIDIGNDAYENGFTVLILPFGSQILETYAKGAPMIDQLFMKNIAGWVSGINLSVNNGESAKVVNGKDLKFYDNLGIAFHIELPEHQLASIGIINIFEPDEVGPSITFTTDSFEVEDCMINGKITNLSDYIAKKNIDTKLPLVSNYSGSNINISIKEISDRKVKLYAPVFEGLEYKFAKKIDDYSKEFGKNIATHEVTDIAFSCNCILNFLYGELEGKTTKPFFGQVTFGEIAYQLVNQTLVYIRIQ